MINANKIYRKEDIVGMSTKVVNEGWGANGADTYDIFKYKGGGNCHHRWNKQVYATFEGTSLDITENAKDISTSESC
jgi:hypothetical protein